MVAVRARVDAGKFGCLHLANLNCEFSDTFVEHSVNLWCRSTGDPKRGCEQLSPG